MERNDAYYMKLADERYEEIKRAVVDMFNEHNVNCVPISAFEIATKMGIKMIPYSAKPERLQILLLKESEDGFVVQKEEVWYIFYNDQRPYKRINNTVMHEIGHIVLDHTEESELAEAEVKFFAKYALAPPVLIHKLKLDSIWEISTAFDISIEAAQYAYDYYKKWLRYGKSEYTSYEKEILTLFKSA